MTSFIKIQNLHVNVVAFNVDNKSVIFIWELRTIMWQEEW